MAEYIDREALLKEMQYRVPEIGLVAECINGTIDICVAEIKKRPAADVEEVKHGRWVMKETLIKSPFAKNAYCSECLEETERHYSYCPNCGAKMDGWKDNG